MDYIEKRENWKQREMTVVLILRTQSNFSLMGDPSFETRPTMTTLSRPFVLFVLR